MRLASDNVHRLLVAGRAETKIALPVDAFVAICALPAVPTWSNLRLQRAKCMVALGFLAYLWRREIIELDVCDVDVAADGLAYDLIIRQAKNEQYVSGRETPVGRVGLPMCAGHAIDAWLHVVGLRHDRARCVKSTRPWERCVVCGPLFVRLGGRPPKPSREPCGKGVVTAELRSLLAQIPSFEDDHDSAGVCY